jgi:hypothetical protein
MPSDEGESYYSSFLAWHDIRRALYVRKSQSNVVVIDGLLLLLAGSRSFPRRASYHQKSSTPSSLVVKFSPYPERRL